MDHQVVLGQRGLVREGEVYTGRVVLLADVMAFTIVGSKIFDVTVDMELNKTCTRIKLFLTQLTTHITEIVFLSIVLVQTVDVVEPLVWAILAMFVVHVPMLFKSTGLVQGLFK